MEPDAPKTSTESLDALLQESRLNEQRWRNDITSIAAELGSVRQRLLEQDQAVAGLLRHNQSLADDVGVGRRELLSTSRRLDDSEALVVELRREAELLLDAATDAARKLAAALQRGGTVQEAHARIAELEAELEAVRAQAHDVAASSLLLRAAREDEARLAVRDIAARAKIAELKAQLSDAAGSIEQSHHDRRRDHERLVGDLSGTVRDLESMRSLVAARDTELQDQARHIETLLDAAAEERRRAAFLQRFLRWQQAYVATPTLKARRSIRRARKAAQRKRWLLAERGYREVLNDFPRLRAIWIQYGHSLKEQGDLEAAYGAYRRGIEVGCDNADTYLHLGHVQKRLGLRHEAEASLLQALQRRPSMAGLWDDLHGFGWTDARLVDALLDHRSPVVRSVPGRGLRFTVAMLRARRAVARQDWQQAIVSYRAALRSAPDDARVWLLNGHALKEAGQTDAACAAYLQAVTLDPVNQEPRRHLHFLRDAMAKPPSRTGTAPDVPGSLVSRLDEPDEVHMVLTAGRDLQALEHGVFLTTGGDPQFRLSPQGAFPHGLVTIRLEAGIAEPVLRPLLYVWSDDALQTFELPVLAGADVVDWPLHLPAKVTAMRLDPTSDPGVRFALENVSFQRRPALRPGEGMADVNLGSLEYKAWVKLYDTLTEHDLGAMGRRVSELAHRPLLSILMPVYNPGPQYLRRALETVLAQVYPDWELCIADDASTVPEIRSVLREFADRDARIKVVYRQRNGHISAASNSALELVTGAFVVLMDHDDELPPHALYMVADELNRHPETDVIYTDEDKIDAEGRRHDPHFKTSWNPDLFYSQNLIAHMGVYRTELVRKVGGFRIGFEGSQDYDFSLKILGLTSAERIRHIPFVLYHWRIFPGVRTFSSNNADKSVSTARRALVDHFKETRQDVEVLGFDDFPGWWRIKRPLPNPAPTVTLIIPTRDRVELLRGCVEGLLNRTDYPALDVIVIDNGSVEAETLSYFRHIASDARVQVLRVEGPFNYSALNNKAVQMARGEFVGFVNNDIEVMQAGWLTEMMSQAVRPGIGAVGAKLLYANGNIQHAGVTIGVYGVAAHGHRHYPADAIGYFGRPQLQQDLSAVTAAMLVMPRALFNELGGFEQEHLTVGYNDVDLCLRIREAGMRVIYTPFAELLHLESASRGQNVTQEQMDRDRRERAYMQERWGSLLLNDPYYSPNLSLSDEDFHLAFPPRVIRPWLENMQCPFWMREQRRFDAAYPVDEDRLHVIAAATTVVVVAADPSMLFARVAASLLDAALAPARIVVVDTSPLGGTAAGLPGRPRLMQRRPGIEVELVRDGGQDFDLARACNIGVRAACSAEYLLVMSEDGELSPGWFEYLLKAYAVGKATTVLAARAWLPDGMIEEPVSLRDADFDATVALVEDYASLPAPQSSPPHAAPEDAILHPDRIIASGMFFGPRQIICSSAAGLYDELLHVAGHGEDMSHRLRAEGVGIASTTTSLVSLTRPRPRDLVHLWHHVHDYAWLNRKWLGETHDGRIEFVCPFHRGDVLIGLQVAAQAVRLGLPVRMHVAAGLMAWVNDFQPGFPVEPVPVTVPPAEETILNLLHASLHVVKRHDASPRIARSHPMRGLDATNRNLVAAMLEAVGLPASTKLTALRPVPQGHHVNEARKRLLPYGNKVILIHRSGGWGLKTIPDPVLKEIVGFLHLRGFAAVQIGGPGDEQVPYLDGWITEGLSPVQWAALFQQTSALIGVDSWSAHFASILDTPQISLYGSTAPRHVNSKSFFAEQRSPSLVLGPVVDCSPCNSLTCLRAPVDFCLGYTFDRVAVGCFLDNLPDASGLSP